MTGLGTGFGTKSWSPPSLFQTNKTYIMKGKKFFPMLSKHFFLYSNFLIIGPKYSQMFWLNFLVHNKNICIEVSNGGFSWNCNVNIRHGVRHFQVLKKILMDLRLLSRVSILCTFSSSSELVSCTDLGHQIEDAWTDLDNIRKPHFCETFTS